MGGIDTPADMTQWAAQCNLNRHVKFYNAHKRLVTRHVVGLDRELARDDLTPDERHDLETERGIFLGGFGDHVRSNAFLCIYSVYEWALAGILINVVGGPTSQKTGLTRFVDDFRVHCSVRLGKGPGWDFLRACETVRHVLLHAAGNTTLFRDRTRLDPVLRGNRDYFVEVQGGKLIVLESALEELSRVAWEFLKWVTDAVKNCDGACGDGQAQGGGT